MIYMYKYLFFLLSPLLCLALACLLFCTYVLLHRYDSVFISAAFYLFL